MNKYRLEIVPDEPIDVIDVETGLVEAVIYGATDDFLDEIKQIQKQEG